MIKISGGFQTSPGVLGMISKDEYWEKKRKMMTKFKIFYKNVIF